MGERETKQVIVMRRYFPDGEGGQKKVRTGKMMSQAAHAAMAVFFDRSEVTGLTMECRLTVAMAEWSTGSFGKIVVSVDTEEELLEIYQQAQDAELPCSLITDSGRTEFDGEPTHTAVAVGPAYADEVDKITGDLPLM